MIWGHVVDNTQQRVMTATGQTHYLTFYCGSWYDEEEEEHPKYTRGGIVVTAGERLWVRDEDTDTWHSYRFAAPRPDLYSPGCWDGLNALACELEWMACKESRDYALKHVENLVKELPEEDEDVEDPAEGGVDDDDESNHDSGSESNSDSGSESNSDSESEFDSDSDSDSEYGWRGPPDVLPEEGLRIQTVVRFKVDGETRLLPITARRDLLVLQTFPNLVFHAGKWPITALGQFDSLNMALEFDTFWGYPAENPLRFGSREVDAYGPHGDPNSAIGDPSIMCPLEWILTLVEPSYNRWNYPLGWWDDPNRRFWFIDHRIRLHDDAIIDEEHPDFPKYVFRDSRYYYVEVKERDTDWGYCTPDDGVDVHRFVEQLQRLVDDEIGEDHTLMCDSKIGVLARVPIEEVEVVEDEEDDKDGEDGAQVRLPTSFRGIVKRSYVPVEDIEEGQCEEDPGVEEAFHALEV